MKYWIHVVHRVIGRTTTPHWFSGYIVFMGTVIGVMGTVRTLSGVVSRVR